MKNVSVWSRSRLEPPFYPGAGADPSMLEPELTPGPWTTGAGFGAGEKGGGSATLVLNRFIFIFNLIFFVKFKENSKRDIYTRCA